MVLRQGLTLTLSGIAVGVASAVLLARLVSDLLYGVSAIDPMTFVVIPLILLARRRRSRSTSRRAAPAASIRSWRSGST